MTLQLFRKDHKYQEWISALSINSDGAGISLQFPSHTVQVISCCFLVSVSNILIHHWVNHLLNTVSRWFGFAVVISMALRDYTFQRTEGAQALILCKKERQKQNTSATVSACFHLYQILIWTYVLFEALGIHPEVSSCSRLRKQVKMIFVKEAQRIKKKNVPWTSGWGTIKRNLVG